MKTKNHARAAAQDAGATQYYGPSCLRCGSTLRYVSTNACVPCETERTRKRRAARRAARAAGECPTTYTGRPCRRCGETKKYFINKTCVACSASRAKAWRKWCREDEKPSGGVQQARCGT